MCGLTAAVDGGEEIMRDKVSDVVEKSEVALFISFLLQDYAVERAQGDFVSS